MLLTWLLPGVLLPYRPQFQGRSSGHFVDDDLWIAYQRSQWWIQHAGFCIVLADRGINGGSFFVLASDSGGGRRSRWQLMMDPNGGSGQWLWTIVASDLDGGSWSYWLLTIDYDCSRTMQCLPLRMLLKPLSWICSTLDICCTSVHPGRGIPHMWLSLRFLRSFYPVKRGF